MKEISELKLESFVTFKNQNVYCTDAIYFEKQILSLEIETDR